MPRTSRLAVGGPAGETTDFDADYKLSPLERMLLTAAVCTEMPAPPTGRALLRGGGSAMALDVQGGYRAVCGRSGGVPRNHVFFNCASCGYTLVPQV